MTQTAAEAQKPSLSDSTFHMWRCVIAVAQADGEVEDAELDYLGRVISGLRRDYRLTAEQSAILGEDLVPPAANLSQLLPHVTAQEDREQLFYFGALMAQADGEIEPGEEAILRKLGGGTLSEQQMAAYLDEARHVMSEKKFHADLAAARANQPKGLRGIVRRLLERLALNPPDEPV
jgi:tellurite resistance protein